MMPPQAEASLALEYSTDTRKLQGGQHHLGSYPTRACPTPSDFGSVEVINQPHGTRTPALPTPPHPTEQTRHSPEHDSGHCVDGKKKPDDEDIAVHQDLAILQDGRECRDRDGELDEASDEPSHPMHRVVQTHHLHHLQGQNCSVVLSPTLRTPAASLAGAGTNRH